MTDKDNRKVQVGDIVHHIRGDVYALVLKIGTQKYRNLAGKHRSFPFAEVLIIYDTVGYLYGSVPRQDRFTISEYLEKLNSGY